MRHTLYQMFGGEDESCDVCLDLAEMIYQRKHVKKILNSAAKIIGTNRIKSYSELCGIDLGEIGLEEHEGIKIYGYGKRTVSLDGINGSGKTTAIRSIEATAQKMGISTRILRPIFSNSLYGNVTRSLFRDPFLSFEVFSDTLVVLADYLYTITRILPQVEEGLIVFDRSKYTTLAVQSSRMHYDEKVGLSKSVEACSTLFDIFPNMTKSIILDVNIDTALKRLETQRNERHVNTNLDFTNERQMAIFRIACQNFHDFITKFQLIGVDANKSLEEVTEEVKKIVFE